PKLGARAHPLSDISLNPAQTSPKIDAALRHLPRKANEIDLPVQFSLVVNPLHMGSCGVFADMQFSRRRIERIPADNEGGHARFSRRQVVEFVQLARWLRHFSCSDK